MTLNQFLVRLRKTPREWTVRYDGRLLLSKSCPITAVAGHKLWATHWDAVVVAIKMGLREQTARRIIDAADLGYLHTVLRKKLLKACGLVTPRP